MKNYISIFIMLFCLLLFSCGNNEEAFSPVQFEVSGIILEKSDRNDITFYGNISAEGGDITFTIDKDNNGELSRIETEETIYIVPDSVRLTKAPFTLLQSKWHKIEVTSRNPYTIRIQVDANKTSSVRHLHLIFGGGYHLSEIYITQIPV